MKISEGDSSSDLNFHAPDAPGAGQIAPTYPNRSGCFMPILNDSRPPIENPVIAVFSLPVATEYSLSISGISSVVRTVSKLSYAVLFASPVAVLQDAAISSGRETYLRIYEKTAADFDANGIIDAIDASLILSVYVKNSTS